MATRKRGKAKKLASTSLSIGLLIVAIVGLFGYVLPIYNGAKNLGITIGDKTGRIVGNVLGSFDGITNGLTNGASDGKEEGLSAKDTKAEIKNSFSEVGNLEVLEAGVKLSDVNTLGDDYAALFVLKGVAIYSIDLQEVDINDIDDTTVEILLPEVNVEIYIDERATEKLAEYQEHSWSGRAQDGFVEYMNSRSVTDASVKDTMENYDVLTEAAENAAKKQISNIANAATGNKKDIVVKFKKEVEG
jgi:hypothetical protein